MTQFTIDISPELNETDTLIRYFDLNKFLSLIEKEELYLARSDSFDDIFEGEYISQVYEYCRHLFSPVDGNSQSPTKNLRENVGRCKGNAFISCWNLDKFESDALWKLYGNGNGSIAIKTTVKKLEKVTLSSNNDFLGLAKGNLSKVEYIDHHKPNEDLLKELMSTKLAPLTKKNKGFAFEKEVRLIVDFLHHPVSFYQDQDHCKCKYKYVLGEKIKSLHLPICLSSLIEEIIISPYESEEFYNLIKKFVEPHGLAEKVKWSTMKIPPFYL
jgi:hypothetical protein